MYQRPKYVDEEVVVGVDGRGQVGERTAVEGSGHFKSMKRKVDERKHHESLGPVQLDDGSKWKQRKNLE